MPGSARDRPDSGGVKLSARSSVSDRGSSAKKKSSADDDEDYLLLRAQKWSSRERGGWRWEGRPGHRGSNTSSFEIRGTMGSLCLCHLACSRCHSESYHNTGTPELPVHDHEYRGCLTCSCMARPRPQQPCKKQRKASRSSRTSSCPNSIIISR